MGDHIPLKQEIDHLKLIFGVSTSTKKLLISIVNSYVWWEMEEMVRGGEGKLRVL